MERTVIKADGLTKSYSLGTFFNRIRINALDDVNFEVKSERPIVVSLIGESGSGKTTLARVLLGLVDPSAGTLEIEGSKISARRDQSTKIQTLCHLVQPIFQNPFEAFSAYRKVDSYLRDTAQQINKARPGPEAETQIEEALRSVGLHYSDVVGKYPNQFSGGELQRVSVARALIARPKLIVADEPVSMIDASLRMNVVNLFRQIKQDYQTSFLYITHDLATAYYISDVIAILYRGCVVEFGAASDVLSKPLHPYTQLLLASVAHVGIKWEKREKMADLETKEYRLVGCRFADRCSHVMGKCRSQRPEATHVEDGRDVYCFLYE